MKSIELSVSILAANFARLGEQVAQLVTAGVDSIHVDVMDMHYVPNLSFGAQILSDIQPYLHGRPAHVHLMVEPVKALCQPFVNAGASSLTFHPGVVKDVPSVISYIESLDCKVGLAINPDEPVEIVAPYLSNLDRLLVMSVVPGFGGQAFMPIALTKIAELKALCAKYAVAPIIEIDGGVKLSNCAQIAATGVDSMVMGTGLVAGGDFLRDVKDFRTKTTGI